MLRDGDFYSMKFLDTGGERLLALLLLCTGLAKRTRRGILNGNTQHHRYFALPVPWLRDRYNPSADSFVHPLMRQHLADR